MVESCLLREQNVGFRGLPLLCQSLVFLIIIFRLQTVAKASCYRKQYYNEIQLIQRRHPRKKYAPLTIQKSHFTFKISIYLFLSPHPNCLLSFFQHPRLKKPFYNPCIKSYMWRGIRNVFSSISKGRRRRPNVSRDSIPKNPHKYFLEYLYLPRSIVNTMFFSRTEQASGPNNCKYQFFVYSFYGLQRETKYEFVCCFT